MKLVFCKIRLRVRENKSPALLLCLKIIKESDNGFRKRIIKNNTDHD